jgi:hypothetical protein
MACSTEAKTDQWLPPTTLQIEGGSDCHQDVGEALHALSDRDSGDYFMVLDNIGLIKCVKGDSGMRAYDTPPTFLVGDQTRKHSKTWLGGAIVHDATHSALYHNYQSAHPNTAVPDEVWTGKEAEAVCLKVQEGALRLIGAPEEEIETVANALSTNYWDVPQGQRTW